GLLDALDLASK
nr:Chain P, EXOENZYME S PEPTIDE [Pseudomonas aeruginosa]